MLYVGNERALAGNVACHWKGWAPIGLGPAFAAVLLWMWVCLAQGVLLSVTFGPPSIALQPPSATLQTPSVSLQPLPIPLQPPSNCAPK